MLQNIFQKLSNTIKETKRSYCNRQILNSTNNTKTTGKSHIDQLLPKLSTACYTIRVVKPLMTQETLVVINYAYFHSILNYGIIFWGNSSYNTNTVRLQKKATTIITNTWNRDSCRHLFKTLIILPIQSPCIFSLLCFLVKNMDQYKVKLDIHRRNTRQCSNLHLTTNLSLYRRGTYYMGTKILHSLPSYIENSFHSTEQFKLVLLLLKNFLYMTSFIHLKNILVAVI